MSNNLTQARLKEFLDYDPETGDFTRLVSTTGCVKVGDVAGTLSHGYISIRIDYKAYLAHRLAFLYMTGKFPTDECDHINHIKDDNRWENLREATHFLNGKNQSMPSDNTSGCVGVSWHKAEKRWQARIKANNRHVFLGLYTKKSDAIAAREAANIKYAYHENHGATNDG